jgi:sulfite reductase (NADPH) hemoprotein beta-component
MYLYDEFDRTLVAERVAEFRDQVLRRLSGELTEEEFKPLRLMNGIYLQLHAYMARISIPYGTLSSEQLRMLAHVGRRYDRGYGHFTTRQNIQFNWIKLEDLPDAMADLARAGLHGMQTSGNCVRNVTTDQWAGVAAGEVEDPRIWAELLRQHCTMHPEFTFLPRKFKIALTACSHDRAAIKVHDIGLRLHRNGAGEAGFEVIVGGGLGRTPFIGKTIKPFLPKRDLVSYVEAILRVYNQAGRRDNIYKARIKIVVHDLGAEAFAKAVEAEWLPIKDGPLALDPAVVADIAARFRYPDYARLEDNPPELARLRQTDRRFAAWLDNAVTNHKVPGHAIVTLSLKPEGGPPGDATSEQMEAIADLADRYSCGEIRVCHEQNLVLPHVAQRDLPALWRALDAVGVATPNVGLVSDIIACPGLDYCSLANARAIPVAQELTRRFRDLELARGLGRLHINISGCINACGHHHVGHIGILGVEKNGEEFYQITIGGRADEKAELGALIGPAVPYGQVADVVEDIVAAYVELRERPDESFVQAVKRLGVEPFKERVYATH